MSQHTAIPEPLYGNPSFDHGLACGIGWYQTGDTKGIPPTWQQIVEFIQDNMLEPSQEGFLTPERLVDNAGFLVGWVLGKYVS